MSLKDYIERMDESQVDLIRCCSCLNAVIFDEKEGNNFTIESYESPHATKTFEGVLCLDCAKSGRQIERAIVLSGPDKNIISYMQIVRPKQTTKPQSAETNTSTNTIEPNTVQ